MNNINVENVINDCKTELNQLEIIVNNVGAMSPMSKYLTLYSLIKACGVLEYSYKNIVADFHNNASQQVQTYIDNTVRGNSKNPSLENMRSLLKQFDSSWITSFNGLLNAHPNKQRLTQSLSSLNDNRNNFAHGQPCTASFSNIKDYFTDAVEIIKMIDSVVV